MRRWYLGIWGSLGLALAQTGCEPPEGITDGDPARSSYSANSPEGESQRRPWARLLWPPGRPRERPPRPAPYTPALPTAKGQTKTTKGGVKYETLKEGTGDELKPGVVALLHYEGRLETARSSTALGRKRQPLKVVLGTGQLIKGWEEALPGMKVGEIRKLFVPAAMAYGDQKHAEIPANSNLIFEVELLQHRQLTESPIGRGLRLGRRASGRRRPANLAPATQPDAALCTSDRSPRI